MNADLRELARKLAARPYSYEVARDETTGGEVVFLARHPELPGCMAHGDTMPEAIENLSDARFEYILSLLEAGLPVHDPVAIATTTSTSLYSVERVTYRAPGNTVAVDEVAETREFSYTVVPVPA